MCGTQMAGVGRAHLRGKRNEPEAVRDELVGQHRAATTSHDESVDKHAQICGALGQAGLRVLFELDEIDRNSRHLCR